MVKCIFWALISIENKTNSKVINIVSSESYSINETIKTIIELCRPYANSKNVLLEIKTDKPSIVVADNQMLNTIIRNLITNAIKFTYPLGLVKIETKILENEVMIIISDTGIGIDGNILC